MKALLLLITTLISLFATDIQTKTGVFPDKEMKSQNKTIAAMVAKEIDRTLPNVIDKYTTLISVINKDTTLLYTFHINGGAKSDETIRRKDRSRMKKAITNGVCQSSSKFLIAGINTSYIYLSASTKAHLFQFDITQKDCPLPTD